MTKKTIILIVVAVIVIVALGSFFYLTRPAKAPSGDIQDSAEVLTDNSISSQAQIYRISQVNSSVEFNINEVRNNQFKTVIGETNQVAGDIKVNLTDPAKSEVGTIKINARTFKTDSDRRDGTIARFILKSEKDEFEFIEFKPKTLTDLPSKIEVGKSFNLKIIGDLTIAGVSREVIFDATSTLVSENELAGSAKTIIQYPDFEISIPKVPSVASVENQVILKIDFKALKI